MAKFLTQSEVYRMIQRELPAGVYATGSATGSYTCADDGAFSQVIETLYSNLSTIYDNYFPGYCLERIADWEITVFGVVGSAFVGVTERKQNVLDKLQEEAGISIPVITDKIARTFAKEDLISQGSSVATPDWLLDLNYLDVDTYVGFRDPLVPFSTLQFDLVSWACGGGWILDESALDVDTYLSGLDPARGVGLDCDLNYAALGLSADDLLQIQATAYTYEVRIHGTADQTFLDYLDAQLKQIEPARATHYIYNNYPDPIDP